jgi:mannose-6-phosphate isomerase-like protein (cupin superfamily)
VNHGLRARILGPGSGTPFPGAGGDAITLRLETQGDDPITWVEDETEDREWAPRHAHPWDELTYVLEGEIEFRVGAEQGVGGPGTLVTLPAGVPHTLRVPEGRARFAMITIGAPSASFLREVGEEYACGPTLERLVAIAQRHGVTPAFEE